MANETTYALISDVLNPVYEGALWYAQKAFVMSNLVTVFTDMRGMSPRKVTVYEETGVLDNLAELDNLTPVEFDRDLLATLTPKEVGKQFIITDRRVESDNENVYADAAKDIGYTMGRKVEEDLINVFASFTGGSAGTKAGAFDIQSLFSARARLEAAGIPSPYYAVIHPYQYLDVWNTFTALASPAPLDVRNNMVSNYYITRFADINIVVSALVPITTDGDGIWARGGMFSRDAIAFDLRRGLRIEPQRDASLRATELNATMIYARGVWRAERGVIIYSDATTPA